MQKEPLTIEELISSLYAAYLSNLESISYAHRVDCADRTKFEVIIRQSISPVFDRIANPDGGTDARDAMLEWFCVLAEGERESSWRLTIVPPTWVDVFAEFYQRGAIGLLAFGMAVRGVYMLGASALDKGGERHTDYLSIMRMMPPEALEHFPTIRGHRDWGRTPAGKEWRAAGARSPCKRRDAPRRCPAPTAARRADFGPVRRREVLKDRHIPAPSLLALNQNRLRHGDPE